VKNEDGIDLQPGDFRTLRRYLAPWLFADSDDATTYPPPSDLMPEKQWDTVEVLPTDVALKTSSYAGSRAARLADLWSDWVSSWPGLGQAPFMEEASLLAGEEFQALTFNALHGYYRQAIGCLRNSLETLTVAAGLAVTGNMALFTQWRQQGQQISFGQARAWLRDSTEGTQIEAEGAPDSIFGDHASAWLKDRYARLCAYAHSQSGYNNADFWESNGPVYSPQALAVVETELRETLALAYLLQRLGWPGYTSGVGQSRLLAGTQGDWAKFHGLLQHWLL
jgi:hypothetical protein